MKVIGAGGIGSHGCDPSAWYFEITSIADESLAPGSITVRWANGDQQNVGRLSFGGGTAHYATTSGLDSQVVSATATIYGDWAGTFTLTRGPCPPTPTATQAAAGQ